ncbi:GNAT family N-acetyltransferase [Bacillus sp. RG28]|uniref:GNAT family N-acetyltransferase n=1 Tax=Gottfriedia endophytica TaxID=2820819 RepID=A0A940SIQ7_9BACI|nr:GNAT family N-acetyltransferase [Gottfriedia endophytica]MBP0725240.1 GNAT family N-acetyltransferase [Gottfriedia endophytica]
MVNLFPVSQDEEAILHNLMQFYIYEFSKYLQKIKLEQNGSYKPFELDQYWTNPNFHAFFIKLEEEYIGFTLVENETETSPNSIREFFIIQKYNGRGYGKIVATKLFNMFPGKWRITQVEKNYPAQGFWRSTISNYTNDHFKERYDENRKSIQEFDTRLIN